MTQRASMKRRRQARAAFRAAAHLVEACLNMPAVPKPGEERLRGRAIACHVAREAFGAPMFLIAQAAGLDRRTVDAAARRKWDARDADPMMEARIDMMITTLRAIGANNAKLARSALQACTDFSQRRVAA